jgi:hypothetical protein
LIDAQLTVVEQLTAFSDSTTPPTACVSDPASLFAKAADKRPLATDLSSLFGIGVMIAVVSASDRQLSESYTDTTAVSWYWLASLP